MSQITTHVLDTSRGRPAENIEITLEHSVAGEWRSVASGRTDADGRLRTLLPAGVAMLAGRYRLTFALDRYFQGLGVEAFYPSASVVFDVRSTTEHYHVPLLLSPFGYSTYRGS